MSPDGLNFVLGTGDTGFFSRLSDFFKLFWALPQARCSLH